MTTTLRSLRFSDASAQNHIQISDIALDLTVGDLLDGVLARMQLPQFDPSGRPLAFQLRANRLGRHLHRSERVEVLQDDDELVLHPSVDAGGI